MALAMLAVACVVLGGCGDRGPRRYRIRGSVTFAGEPVPAGRIVFEPDSSRGNSGPQGFAYIFEGRYDTAEPHSKGTVGGATRVLIDGIKLAEGVDAPIAGRPLFPTHEESIDLPKAATIHDFDVPRSVTR